MRIVIAFSLFVVLLILLTMGLSGCGNRSLPTHNEFHQLCTAQGGSFKSCDEQAVQYCATNVCAWGGK